MRHVVVIPPKEVTPPPYGCATDITCVSSLLTVAGARARPRRPRRPRALRRRRLRRAVRRGPSASTVTPSWWKTPGSDVSRVIAADSTWASRSTPAATRPTARTTSASPRARRTCSRRAAWARSLCASESCVVPALRCAHANHRSSRLHSHSALSALQTTEAHLREYCNLSYLRK